MLGVVVKDRYESPIFGINNRIVPGYQLAKGVTSGEIVCHFVQIPLMPGSYSLDLYLGDEHRDIDIVTQALSFHVDPADVFGSGKLPPDSAGSVFVPATWSFDNCAEQTSSYPDTP